MSPRDFERIALQKADPLKLPLKIPLFPLPRKSGVMFKLLFAVNSFV
jgi:hypothetical protein